MEHDIRAFYFEPNELEALASRLRDCYVDADPFPHVVIDEFLPRAVAERVLDEFPAPRDAYWKRWDKDTELKLQTTAELGMGPVTRQVLNQFNSSAFVDFLEHLTGIEHLVPDPHLLGGGLHQIERGGFLKIHADFNTHPRLELERRLNLLLYLNPDWIDSYGGALELWDREMHTCTKRISPIFNRCVIFSITSDAFHGHPEPLSCPTNITRRSLALYYYSKNRPKAEMRPSHSTLFQARPGETRFSAPKSTRDTLRRFVPPILVERGKAWRQRHSR